MIIEYLIFIVALKKIKFGGFFMSNDNLANPAPLGLLGFGMTTILLNIHNAGFFPLDTMIMAMGIFYGGMAQVTAGIMEFKKGNTFGTVAFTSYGFFWMTLVFLLVSPWGQTAPSGMAMPAYFLMWGLFTFCMFIGTLNGNRGTQVIFGSLTVLFVLLAIRDITGSQLIGTITGWEGIFCGFSAFYVAIAEILNEKFDKTVLPLG